MELTMPSRSTEYERDKNGRESIWTFPRRWRFRFFVIFYSLVIGTTVWGTYETIVAIAPNGLNYRNFIVVYVQSIAGSVVTSMLIIDFPITKITIQSDAVDLVEPNSPHTGHQSRSARHSIPIIPLTGYLERSTVRVQEGEGTGRSTIGSVP